MRKLLFILSFIILAASFSSFAQEKNNSIWEFSKFNSKELEHKLNISRACAGIYGAQPNVIDLAKENGLLESLSEKEIKESKESYIKVFIVFSQFSSEIRSALAEDHGYNKQKIRNEGVKEFKRHYSNWLANARKLIKNYSTNSDEMNSFLDGFERIKRSCIKMLRNTPRKNDI